MSAGRILVAKPGLDGHDRGAKIVAQALRDAGFEVVYTGLRQTPESIVEAAVQEDVDAIGISLHSGAHMTVFPRIVALLAERKASHVLVTGGGIIPPSDAEALKAMGVGRLFGPGTPTRDLVEYLRAEVASRRSRAAKPAEPPASPPVPPRPLRPSP